MANEKRGKQAFFDPERFGSDAVQKEAQVILSNNKEKHPHTHTDTDEDTDISRPIGTPVKENRTRKLWLLTKPSVHRKVNNYAKETGDTFNNIVNTLLENYIQEKGL